MIKSTLAEELDNTLDRYIPQFSSKASLDLVGDVNSCILQLYRILANKQGYCSYNDAITDILVLGELRFGCQSSLVLKSISADVNEVKAFHGGGGFFVGQHIQTSIMRVLAAHTDKRIVIQPNLNALAFKKSSIEYNSSESRAYLGVNLELNSGERGVVCFLSDSECSFDQDDIVLLELMAEGIACMMDLQSTRAQRKTEDLALFASGSIKSLEEYQASAELPEGLGISGKVVDVLKRRIGHSSLSIDNIADELNLSKRTLQRRLQQQEISFAELRDRVRFHFSIDFLVKQQISIDRISSTLDFSDRTSFTNAFKRWTGLSPSTFRKVFRDYA